ncbi:hypothetical protein AMAG_19826 [Allomyces macrogynus ATCC 38327]|uniref:Telomere length regulation protein conserved domain-containing protein n=1 Tax=Allomyces macrogynus (strain ATCC 38327) TaxID=578462 RepID=A0A0L0T027_ALLM3|nr:hypothetical protein AMAG_19826 [Allomyces macrogynus ATCC 38327]|eukprot:KNE67990.1 hypothetical protein AMAG_19826 [Allomyces macrogynus ATCC 38327]
MSGKPLSRTSESPASPAITIHREFAADLIKRLLLRCRVQTLLVQLQAADSALHRHVLRTLVSIPDRAANVYQGSPPKIFAADAFVTRIVVDLDEALRPLPHSGSTTGGDLRSLAATLVDQLCRQSHPAPQLAGFFLSRTTNDVDPTVSFALSWRAALGHLPDLSRDAVLLHLLGRTEKRGVLWHSLSTCLDAVIGRPIPSSMVPALTSIRAISLGPTSRAAIVHLFADPSAMSSDDPWPSTVADSMLPLVSVFAAWLHMWGSAGILAHHDVDTVKALTETLLLCCGYLQADHTSLASWATRLNYLLYKGVAQLLDQAPELRAYGQILAEEATALIFPQRVDFGLGAQLPDVARLRAIVAAGAARAGAARADPRSAAPETVTSDAKPQVSPPAAAPRARLHPALCDSDDEDDSDEVDEAEHALTGSVIPAAKPVSVYIRDCLDILQKRDGEKDADRLIVVVLHLEPVIRATPAYELDAVAPGLVRQLHQFCECPIDDEGAAGGESVEVKFETAQSNALVALGTQSPVATLGALLKDINRPDMLSVPKTLEAFAAACRIAERLAFGTITSSSTTAKGNDLVPAPFIDRAAAAIGYKTRTGSGTVTQRLSGPRPRPTAHRNRMMGVTTHFLSPLIAMNVSDREPRVMERRLLACANVLFAAARILTRSRHPFMGHTPEFFQAVEVWEWIMDLMLSMHDAKVRRAALIVIFAPLDVVQDATVAVREWDAYFALLAQWLHEWKDDNRHPELVLMRRCLQQRLFELHKPHESSFLRVLH